MTKSEGTEMDEQTWALAAGKYADTEIVAVVRGTELQAKNAADDLTRARIVKGGHASDMIEVRVLQQVDFYDLR